MQGQLLHYLHLPGNSMSPTALSAPAQETTASYAPGQNNAICLLSFFLAPGDSLRRGWWCNRDLGEGNGFIPLAGTGERGPGRAWVLAKEEKELRLCVPSSASLPACPCPSAAAAVCYAHVPPQQQHYCCTTPSAISPQVLVCFFLFLLLTFTAAAPLQPLLHPCSCPLCSQDAKSTGSCMVWQQPSPGSSGTTWALLLHQCSLSPKKLLWRLHPLLMDALHH